MGATLIDITPCLPLLEQQGLILTPNNRLRNKLLQAYAYHQHQNGQHNWSAPAIISLSEWLLQCYEAHLLSPHSNPQLLSSPQQPSSQSPVIIAAVISSAQRQALWRDIISNDDQGAELINPGRLVVDADNAYRHLQLWQRSIADLCRDLDLISGKDEASAFVRWATAFEQKLSQQGMITAEHMQGIINQLLQTSPPTTSITNSKPIGCYGFDDIPPLTATTLALCNAQIIPIAQHLNAQVCRREYATLADEIQAAARWSKTVIESQPQARVGIISPNLGQIRQQLERHFSDTFEPHSILPEHLRYTLPFNFSAGVPLGKTPLVYDALQLLRLQSQQLNCEVLCSLLYSPFWGEAPSLPALTRIAAKIRQLSRETINSSQFRRLVHQLTQQLAAPNNVNAEQGLFLQWLDDLLQQLADNYRRSYNRQSASRWAEFFIEQLQLWQWPGSRRLDSNEYQQMQQWLNLLEEFTLLDALDLQLSHAEALEQLTKLAGSSHFQAQTPESPIQILGVLEGSGLRFSHCWVLGLNHKQWPPAPQPNPLLPVELQRQEKMPHADADRELIYAETLTRNYQGCAPVVIFSSARHDEESPLQPSPLIKALPLDDTAVDSEPHGANDLAAYQQALMQHSQLEWVHIANGPPVNSTELGLLKGGSNILRDQAICPFAAFVVHRLGAKAPLPAVHGLSPIDRGNILHNTLASFWDTVKTQAQLLLLDTEQQQQLVAQHLDVALAPYSTRAADAYGPEYLRLEKQRQLGLICQWLETERQRPAFSVIGTEVPLQHTFHGLPLSLRLDRLDQLNNGELIVIDYKTGSPALKSWQGENPTEPQLPLYTLCYSAAIHGLMFIELNVRNTRCLGLGQFSVAHEGITPIADNAIDLPDNWQDTLTHWDNVLGRLTDDFLSGEALAAFTSEQHKRNYDDLTPLTRLLEQPRLQQLYNAHGTRTLTASDRFSGGGL